MARPKIVLTETQLKKSRRVLGLLAGEFKPDQQQGEGWTALATRLGVTRQAVHQWWWFGIPAERCPSVCDLAKKHGIAADLKSLRPDVYR